MGSQSASDRYFVLFGSHESPTNEIELAHTFAVFFRTIDQQGSRLVVEVRSLSWLPASGIISMARPGELGVNKPLDETLRWAAERGLPVVFEGPYETDQILFQRAVEQAGRMERGEIRYKCFDRYSRRTAMNCIHAISDLVDGNGLLNTRTTRGREATLMVVNHLRAHLLTGEKIPAADAARLFAAANIRRVPPPATTTAASIEIPIDAMQ